MSEKEHDIFRMKPIEPLTRERLLNHAQRLATGVERVDEYVRAVGTDVTETDGFTSEQVKALERYSVNTKFAEAVTSLVRGDDELENLANEALLRRQKRIEAGQIQKEFYEKTVIGLRRIVERVDEQLIRFDDQFADTAQKLASIQEAKDEVDPDRYVKAVDSYRRKERGYLRGVEPEAPLPPTPRSFYFGSRKDQSSTTTQPLLGGQSSESDVAIKGSAPEIYDLAAIIEEEKLPIATVLLTIGGRMPTIAVRENDGETTERFLPPPDQAVLLYMAEHMGEYIPYIELNDLARKHGIEGRKQIVEVIEYNLRMPDAFAALFTKRGRERHRSAALQANLEIINQETGEKTTIPFIAPPEKQKIAQGTTEESKDGSIWRAQFVEHVRQPLPENRLAPLTAIATDITVPFETVRELLPRNNQNRSMSKPQVGQSLDAWLDVLRARVYYTKGLTQRPRLDIVAAMPEPLNGQEEALFTQIQQLSPNTDVRMAFRDFEERMKIWLPMFDVELKSIMLLFKGDTVPKQDLIELVQKASVGKDVPSDDKLLARLLSAHHHLIERESFGIVTPQEATAVTLIKDRVGEENSTAAYRASELWIKAFFGDAEAIRELVALKAAKQPATHADVSRESSEARLIFPLREYSALASMLLQYQGRTYRIGDTRYTFTLAYDAAMKQACEYYVNNFRQSISVGELRRLERRALGRALSIVDLDDTAFEQFATYASEAGVSIMRTLRANKGQYINRLVSNYIAAHNGGPIDREVLEQRPARVIDNDVRTPGLSSAIPDTTPLTTGAGESWVEGTQAAPEYQLHFYDAAALSHWMLQIHNKPIALGEGFTYTPILTPQEQTLFNTAVRHYNQSQYSGPVEKNVEQALTRAQQILDLDGPGFRFAMAGQRGHSERMLQRMREKPELIAAAVAAYLCEQEAEKPVVSPPDITGMLLGDTSNRSASYVAAQLERIVSLSSKRGVDEVLLHTTEIGRYDSQLLIRLGLLVNEIIDAKVPDRTNRNQAAKLLNEKARDSKRITYKDIEKAVRRGLITFSKNGGGELSRAQVLTCLYDVLYGSQVRLTRSMAGELQGLAELVFDQDHATAARK